MIKFMRYAVAALAAAVLFAFTAIAAPAAYSDSETGFSITFPENYVVLNESNLSDNKDFIQKIGYSVKTFRSKLTDGGIKVYAADADNQHQVQVKVWESDLSTEVGTLSTLSEEQLSTALATVSEQISLTDGDTVIESGIAESNGLAYLRCTVRVGSSFCYTQYLTVVNSKCVALVYYNSSAQLSGAETAECAALFGSFSVAAAKKGNIWGGYSLSIRIVSAAVLVAAVVVIVFIVSSFVRDYRLHKDAPEIIPDKIKMKRK